MMRNFAVVFIFVVWLTNVSSLFAQHFDEETTFRQPDGINLNLKVFGNQHYARTENSEGFTVVYVPEKKAYFFAKLSDDGNELVPTEESATNARPTNDGIQQSLMIRARARQAIVAESFEEFQKEEKDNWETLKRQTAALARGGGMLKRMADFGPPNSPPTLGKLVGLTILVDFSDEVARTDLTPQMFDDYCNRDGGEWQNNGSVYDYFYHQSNGRLSYVNNVTYYVRVPNSFSHYNDTTQPRNSGLNGRKLLTDAINKLKQDGFDFTGLTTDSNGLVVATNLFWSGDNSGVWSSGLWPHRWRLSSPMDIGNGMKISDYQMTQIGTVGTPTIGTFCHEDGHLIGKYVDYYDYDGEGGVGQHCLMGSGNHSSQINPASISGYLKFHSGWVDALELRDESGPIRFCADVDPTRVFKYTNPNKVYEYFVIENRSRTGGWEANSTKPDSGLMISHIDERVPYRPNRGYNSDGDLTEARHYEHSIEQADNLFQLERTRSRGDDNDLFHASGVGANDSFSDTTSPNAKWWLAARGDGATGTDSDLNIHDISVAGATMTFVYGDGAPAGSPAIGLSTQYLENACDRLENARSQRFAVVNSQAGTLDFTISDDAAWLQCSPTTGSSTNDTQEIVVAYDTSALATGIHRANITISKDANTTETISVELEVRGEPILAVIGNSLQSSLNSGEEKEHNFFVTNSGDGSLSYSLASDETWITFNESSGTTRGERDLITVKLNSSGLAVGEHKGNITVNAIGVSGSPKTVEVTLNVTQN